MMKSIILVSIFISILLTLVQTTCTSAAELKLNTSDGPAGDNFDRSVSISGNYAFMDAFGDGGGSTNSGRSGSVRPYVTSTSDVVATEVQTDIPVTEDMVASVGIGTEDEEAIGIGMNTGTDESTSAQTEKKGITIFVLIGIIVGFTIIRILNELIFNLFSNI